MQVTKNKGSATVEAAIILPLFISFILVFASVIQCFIALNCINSALFKTSDFLSENAVIYHEKGIKTIEDKLLEELGNKLKFTSYSEVLKYLNMRGIFDSAEDILYQKMAEELFKYYLNKDTLIKNGYIKFNDISFKGSVFLNGNENVSLIVNCKMKLPIPIPENIIKGFSLQSKIKARCWLDGDHPLYSNIDSSVWSLSNFERGILIRSIFGGNLPLSYPVIAKFSDGKASMIKSLDHTANTYQSYKTFKLSIESMINLLHGFTGAEGNNDELFVKPEEILIRELILVLPENELTHEQENVLEELKSECNMKNIILTIQRYQVKK